MLQPLDRLLLAVPAAFVIRYVPAWKNETLLFITTGIAIIPLAGWMGRATEHLGARAGHGNGGLLNATFGNAAELIIALMALSKGLTGAGQSLHYRLDHRQYSAAAWRLHPGRQKPKDDAPPKAKHQLKSDPEVKADESEPYSRTENDSQLKSPAQAEVEKTRQSG